LGQSAKQKILEISIFGVNKLKNWQQLSHQLTPGQLAGYYQALVG